MKKGFVVLAILLLGVSLNIIGCGSRIERFGEAPEETASKTSISTILFNPQNYIDKEVVVEGTIASECPTGGWINVRDASGATIYVEMHSAPFAPIPQRVGKSVLVKGLVYQSEGSTKETKLLGRGLVIK
jgi:uncharacterized protein YdeI (BOF family)